MLIGFTMDHSEEVHHGIDDENNEKKPVASSSTMPIPPFSLPKPMKTNNLLSRLQIFLPQLEAANEGM